MIKAIKNKIMQHKKSGWVIPFIVAVFAPQKSHADIVNGFVLRNPLGANMNIYTFVGNILNFVVKIGTVVVIFMIIYSGFLFIKAQGDSTEISSAKQTFYWTVIGGVVLIGARALAGVVCNTAASLTSGITCTGF